MIELVSIATLKVHLELIIVATHTTSTTILGVLAATARVLIVLATVVELIVLWALWHLTIHLVPLVLSLELGAIVWTTFTHILMVIIVLLEAVIGLIVCVLGIECRLEVRGIVHLLGC